MVALLSQGKKLIEVLRPGQKFAETPEGSSTGCRPSDTGELVLRLHLQDGDAGADGDEQVGEHVLGVDGLEGVGGVVLALELQTDIREVLQSWRRPLLSAFLCFHIEDNVQKG